MARFVLIALLLTLTFVPIASAEVPSQDNAPTFCWLDALWSRLDWLFSWSSTDRIETRKSGAYIIVNGVGGTTTDSGGYIIVNGAEVTTADSGGYIIVNGIRAVPSSPRPQGHPRDTARIQSH